MRRMSNLAGAGIGAMILTLAASIALPLVSSSVASAATAHVVGDPERRAAFTRRTAGPARRGQLRGNGDAAVPQVVYSAGTYYAFTTGNVLGNNIAALVSSSPNWAARPTRAPLRLDGPAEPFDVGRQRTRYLAGRLFEYDGHG